MTKSNFDSIVTQLAHTRLTGPEGIRDLAGRTAYPDTNFTQRANWPGRYKGDDRPAIAATRYTKLEGDQRWKDRAACRGMDPAIFFPDLGQAAGLARDICDQCDVRAECLAYATANCEQYGIWAGMNRDQRNAHNRGAA